MKETLKKISDICKIVFGYGIMLTLFLGGLTFLGYLVALFIGGETATAICTFIYKQLMPVIIYISTCMVLFGLVSMYLAGEKALTSDKKKASKEEGEK
ncbi:MAG: hypothetical protein IKL06_02410 [Lachnospiraceae bacterium]|nr:hypothetical protein [Lachnospiraceae bacterium]